MSIDKLNLVTFNDDHKTTFWTPHEWLISLIWLQLWGSLLIFKVEEWSLLPLKGVDNDILTLLIGIFCVFCLKAMFFKIKICDFSLRFFFGWFTASHHDLFIIWYCARRDCVLFINSMAIELSSSNFGLLVSVHLDKALSSSHFWFSIIKFKIKFVFGKGKVTFL